MDWQRNGQRRNDWIQAFAHVRCFVGGICRSHLPNDLVKPDGGVHQNASQPTAGPATTSSAIGFEIPSARFRRKTKRNTSQPMR